MPNLQINNPETLLTTFNNPRQDEVDRGYVEQYLGFLQSRRLCFLYDSWHQKWKAVDGHFFQNHKKTFALFFRLVQRRRHMASYYALC